MYPLSQSVYFVSAAIGPLKQIMKREREREREREDEEEGGGGGEEEVF